MTDLAPSPVSSTSPPPQQAFTLCESCMNDSLDALKEQIATANNDLSQYTEALFELERDRRSGKCSDDEQDQHLALLQQKDGLLAAELASLRSKEADLLRELDTVVKTNAELDADEKKLCEDILSLTRTVLDSEESMETVNRKLLYCSNSLKKLKRMNLITEAFFIIDAISDDSSFGSINGLRLGRSKDIIVPWAEINAAWGFLCLLMDVLVKKAGVVLTQYRLLPRGNYSVIIKKSDRSALELYSDESTGGGITRFITGRKFDSAMSAFLQILSEVFLHLQAGGEVDFPYKIEEGKIRNLPIALQFNSDENWTLALKYMLANIKLIISIVEVRYS